jgi:nucleotidyltransferase substrate binding protein (TIGR01987 family)
MSLTVEHLLKTTLTLERALSSLQAMGSGDLSEDQSISYDLYRSAAIKSFELSLEATGKLLRKALKQFNASPRSVDSLVFNDLFRHAGKHGMLDEASVVRWIGYRANRNETAHDYGVAFANETLALLPSYLKDVRDLAAKIQGVFDVAT